MSQSFDFETIRELLKQLISVLSAYLRHSKLADDQQKAQQVESDN